MVRAIQSRKLKIDFGLVMEFNVPEDVSDEEACGAIFAAASVTDEQRHNVGCQLSSNLKATVSGIEATGGSTIHLSVKEEE